MCSIWDQIQKKKKTSAISHVDGDKILAKQLFQTHPPLIATRAINTAVTYCAQQWKIRQFSKNKLGGERDFNLRKPMDIIFRKQNTKKKIFRVDLFVFWERKKDHCQEDDA